MIRHRLIVVLIQPPLPRLPRREVFEDFSVDESTWVFAHENSLTLCQVECPVEAFVKHPKLDVTFLMDFDGFDPAFRLVNGMVIVDSFAGFDRLETESANPLVAV